MIALNSATVKRLLPLEECIELMRETMRAVSTGQTKQMLRQILPVPGGVFGIMGGTLPDSFGSKLIAAVKPAGSGATPSHQGVVVLFDPVSGAPAAIIDATSLTAIRTAAASAMATQELARPDASTLAILGTGEQALMHARAICAVGKIDSITLWGRDTTKAERLAETLARELPTKVRVAGSIADAARDAAIVCTVTSATEPFLGSANIAPGTHINAVGSSHLGQREIEDSLVVAASFFGDSLDSVLSQGAEFVQAREAGLIGDAHFCGEIGEVVAGICAGRTSPEEITLYKSLGHVAQDLAAGWHVWRAALAAGAGQPIAL